MYDRILNIEEPQNRQSRFFSAFKDFLSSGYNIHSGSLSLESSGSNPIGYEEKINASLSTRGPHTKILFRAGKENHENEETAQKLFVWLANVRDLA